MLSIIDRYILRQVMTTFLAVVSILTLIVLAQAYLMILKKAAAGALSSGVMLQLLATEAVKISGIVLAPALFFSILLAIGRMYRENEMTALASGGVGLARIFRVVLYSALPVALLAAWLMLTLRPWAYQSRADIISMQKESASIESAVAGRFTEFSRGNLVFYIERIDKESGRLRNVFAQNRQQGKLGIVTADTGYLELDPASGQRFVVLEDGVRYQGVPGDNRFSMGGFGKYRVRVGQAALASQKLPVKALSMEELGKSGTLRARAEMEFRLTAPIAVLVFAVIAVPLSYSAPRSGVYGRLVLAVFFYFVFLNLQALSAKWLVAGESPVWLGTWWIHPFMLLLLGVVIWLRSAKERGLVRRLRGSGQP